MARNGVRARAVLLIAAAAAVALSGDDAAAREIRVDCARAVPARSLAEALPAGVAPGPGLARLAVVRSARVGSARGPLRLLCGYRVQGAVVYVAQRTPADARNCAADARGFTCRLATANPGRGRVLSPLDPPRLIGEEPPRETAPVAPPVAETTPPAPRLAPPPPAPAPPPEADEIVEPEAQALASPPRLITRPTPTPVEPPQATIELGEVLEPTAERRRPPSDAPPAPLTAESRPAPAPPQSGRLAIPPSWTADVDQGRVGAGPESDLWLRTPPEGDDGPRLLETINGAAMTRVGRTIASLAQCEAATLGDRSLDVSTIAVGDVFCMRTTAGRLAQFRIVDTNSSRSSAVVIDFQTW